MLRSGQQLMGMLKGFPAERTVVPILIVDGVAQFHLRPGRNRADGVTEGKHTNKRGGWSMVVMARKLV